MTSGTCVRPDGLHHWPQLFDPTEAAALFEDLRDTVPWEQRESRVGGKLRPQPRLSAYYGEPNTDYRYSRLDHAPLPWHPALLEMRSRLQPLVAFRIVSALLFYYRDGNDSVSWHSDLEKQIGPRPGLVTVVLGQPRLVQFRDPDDHRQKYEFTPEPGDAYALTGCAFAWEHQVPKSASALGPRIVPSFRPHRAIS